MRWKTGRTHARAVGATLATIMLAARVMASSTAQAAGAITASDFHLTKSATATKAIFALDAALPNVSVATVVNSANRDMNPCPSGVPNTVKSWCWVGGDQTTTDWYPQGISTSADAYDAGTYDDKQVVLASWYDHRDDAVDKGTRISFIDASDPTDPDYRHVLLVEPYLRTDGTASFRSVPVHAGGIAWYGYYLYVVDTTRGLRVFDMRHLWQVTTGDTSKIGRQSDGSYQAFDYQYVLPQAFSYQASTSGGQSAFRHSSVALDRTSTPDSLVMTEYREDDNTSQKVRTVRFGLDYTTRLLRTSSDGVARASQAFDLDTSGLQGGIAVNNRWFFRDSDGASNSGDLYRLTPPSTLTRYGDVLPVGVEDLSYWGSRGELWTLGEHPGQRTVVAVRLSAFTG